MTTHLRWLAIIVVITAASLWIIWPDNPGIHIDTDGDGEPDIDKTIETRLGLDLVGGIRVLLAADMPAGEVDAGDMETARRIVENRVNGLGVTEPIVQLQPGSNSIIVELPGIEDPDMAIATIRETGLLEFVNFGSTPLEIGTRVMTDYRLELQQQAEEAQSEGTVTPESEATEGTPSESPTPEEEATPTEAEPTPTEGEGEEEYSGRVYHTVMTGAHLASAYLIPPDPARGLSSYAVGFELNEEGHQIFSEYTSTHVQQYLGIVLDGEVISAPRIREAITDVRGMITGSFTRDSAEQLVIQLRYGALPVPLRVESVETVGPTLGAVSIERSVRAGVIGVITVLLFMLIYYRVPGIAADLALLVFAAINFAVFRWVPVTLTLPAITGFLISVGTAVDGNILIFERMKEELRAGRSLQGAVKAGFERAWTSIRDSNLSTIIICAVLYLFGSTFGASVVRGFAITLALGLVINLFTAVIATRTFLALILNFTREQIEKHRWLLGV